MLDYVWHLRGSVPLTRVGIDADVLDSVAQLLSKQQKDVSEHGSEYVVFDDPFWRNPFGPNWLAMMIYDRGRFWIEQGVHGRCLRYDLRSLHGMVFCLVLAALFFFIGLAGDGINRGFEFGATAFAWLYGANILLALARVLYAIRKAVNST